MTTSSPQGKFKITLITPTPPDISAFGVRSLSAYLRSKGYHTRLIFLPGGICRLSEAGDFVYEYDEKVISRIIELCKGSGLVGISFMSNYFDRAIQITRSVKERLSVPVIWGGIHPSTSPQDSIAHADMVCIGEGEEALLELVTKMERGEDHSRVPGLWVKTGEEVRKNPIRTEFVDLDGLPFFDFSLEDHYVLDRRAGEIKELDAELFKNILPRLPHPDGRLKIAFRTMTDRGCPHKCTYCNISNQKDMYGEKGAKFFRTKSVGKVVEELVSVKKKLPFVEAIQFFDDTFFARSVHEIEEFGRLYKEKVNMPFYCQASPNTISERKMEALVNAGLVYVEMGIQTGSERIKALYNRTESNDRIVQASEIISKYSKKIFPPDYHIILDNPWEKPEDTIETVKLLLRIPKPYGLCISSLVFFPQTYLYRKAKEDGIIKDDVAEIYRKPFFIKPNKSYPNFLIYLLSFPHFPLFLLKLLARQSMVDFFVKANPTFLYWSGYKVGEAIRFMVKGAGVVLHGDTERIRLYFEKLRMNDPVADGRKS